MRKRGGVTEPVGQPLNAYVVFWSLSFHRCDLGPLHAGKGPSLKTWIADLNNSANYVVPMLQAFLQAIVRAKHCGELLLKTTKTGDWYFLNLLLLKRGLLKRELMFGLRLILELQWDRGDTVFPEVFEESCEYKQFPEAWNHCPYLFPSGCARGRGQESLLRSPLPLSPYFKTLALLIEHPFW